MRGGVIIEKSVIRGLRSELEFYDDAGEEHGEKCTFSITVECEKFANAYSNEQILENIKDQIVEFLSLDFEAYEQWYDLLVKDIKVEVAD